jgi:hypothetical protein
MLTAAGGRRSILRMKASMMTAIAVPMISAMYARVSLKKT